MILTEWQSYSLEVIPLNSPEVQRQECRRAFYAGAYAAIMELIRNAENNISDSDGGRLLKGLVEECEQFKTDVIEGRA